MPQNTCFTRGFKYFCNSQFTDDDDDDDDDNDDDDDDEVEEETRDIEESISEYGEEDGDDDRSSNEDGEDTDRLSEDYDNKETIEKNTRRRASDRQNCTKRKAAKMDKSTADKSGKRRHSSTSSDVRSRKSRRTRLKVNYNEDIEDYASSSEDVIDSGDDSNYIGVSSRGRLRKPALRYADFVES